MFTPRPPRSTARGLFWGSLLLCLALLAAQTVGQLHGLAHLGGHGASHTDPPLAAAEAHETGVQVQTRAAVPGAWLAGLFAGHDEASSACLTFDQLGHFDALVGLPLALPMSLTALQLCASVGLAVARWHAQFQARGPPFSH